VIVLGIEGLEAVESIGEGGSAVVYRARDTAHDRDVAVKMLKGLANDDARRRFDRERKLMGRLSNHDGIVTIYSSGFNDRDVPYLVMPYLAGGSLDEYAQRVGPGPHETTVLLAQVARAVAAAHQQNVIHRDLKPANILMSDSQRPLVTDFGIARLNATLASQLSQLAYTPAFSPPEVMQGAEPSTAADVYSLGATLFATLAGRPPFDGALSSSPYPVINRVINEAVEDLGGSVPNDVCDIYRAAMAKDPARRPTIDELIVLLDAATGSDRSPSVGQVSSSAAATTALATELDQPVSPVTKLISEDDLHDGDARSSATSSSSSGEVSSHGDRASRRRGPWLAGVVGVIAVAVVSYMGLGLLGDTTESTATPSTDAPAGSAPPVVQGTGAEPLGQDQETTPAASRPNTAGNLTPNIAAATTPLAVTIEGTATTSTPAASTTTSNSAVSASATTQSTTSPSTTATPTTQASATTTPTTTTTTTSPTTTTVATTSMPNVVGSTHGSAVATLSEAGLAVAACGNSCSALVTRQSPAGGTQVSSGATVTLTVTPNESQPIPDVIGLTGSQAVAVLTVQKPFLASCGSNCSEPVTSMNPAAGTSALPLTVIGLGFG